MSKQRLTATVALKVTPNQNEALDRHVAALERLGTRNFRDPARPSSSAVIREAWQLGAALVLLREAIPGKELDRLLRMLTFAAENILEELEAANEWPFGLSDEFKRHLRVQVLMLAASDEAEMLMDSLRGEIEDEMGLQRLLGPKANRLQAILGHLPKQQEDPDGEAP